MNWDVTFFVLGLICIIIGGVLLMLGPLIIEEGEVGYGKRGTYYKIGAAVALGLLVSGSLLIGLGVPT